LKNVEFPGTETNFKSEELSLIKLEGRNKLLAEAMDYEKLMHKKQDMVNQLRRKESKSLDECVQIDRLDGDIKYLSTLIKEIIWHDLIGNILRLMFQLNIRRYNQYNLT